MKKLLVLLSVVVMLVISLALPAHMVSAKVIRTDVVMTFAGFVPVASPEINVTPGGMTILRGAINNVYYTATDARLQGWCTMVQNQNIRPDGSAQGFGTWVNHPDAYPGGYWQGEFTASRDADGLMHVKMTGKGYGDLAGLFFSGSLENYTFGPIVGVITQNPTYSP
jgi:hypothetical protein